MTYAMPWRVFLVVMARSLAALLLASTLVHAQGLPAKAQPPLREVQLSSGLYLIKAEVADTEATREVGLMFRKKWLTTTACFSSSGAHRSNACG